jgi:hypothetical protein
MALAFTRYLGFGFTKIGNSNSPVALLCESKHRVVLKKVEKSRFRRTHCRDIHNLLLMATWWAIGWPIVAENGGQTCSAITIYKFLLGAALPVVS